ncbi:MAG TPA: ATP-binding protein [Trichocoleus sp.]
MGAKTIRVLLVEDAEEDYLFTRQLLTKRPNSNYQVDWANTYDAAVAAMAHPQHDVYLLDDHLSQQTGFETVRVINSRVPTILLMETCDRTPNPIPARLGISGFLPKANLTTETLAHTIHTAIRQKQVECLFREHADILEPLIEQRTIQLQQHNAELMALLNELREALAQEQNLNATKSQLITTLAHEFRTPLSVINGTAALMSMQQSSAFAPSSEVQRITQNVKRITGMIDNALALVRIDSGFTYFDPAPTHLDSLCAELIDTWMPIGSPHHLRFVTRGEATEIEVDDFLLKILLKNLIENAVQYSPEGGAIALGLFYDSDRAVLCLRDEGIGIPKAEIERVCDRFYRATNASEIPGISGAGLGLAVAKTIVAMHHGTLTIDSVVQKGTTVTIHLPLKQEERGKNREA